MDPENGVRNRSCCIDFFEPRELKIGAREPRSLDSEIDKLGSKVIPQAIAFCSKGSAPPRTEPERPLSITDLVSRVPR